MHLCACYLGFCGLVLGSRPFMTVLVGFVRIFGRAFILKGWGGARWVGRHVRAGRHR